MTLKQFFSKQNKFILSFLSIFFIGLLFSKNIYATCGPLGGMCTAGNGYCCCSDSNPNQKLICSAGQWWDGTVSCTSLVCPPGGGSCGSCTSSNNGQCCNDSNDPNYGKRCNYPRGWETDISCGSGGSSSPFAPPPPYTPPTTSDPNNPTSTGTNPNDNTQVEAGDPISTATGEFYFTMDLIQLTGPMTLAFDINYGSQTLPDINPDGLPQSFESSVTNSLAETNSTETNSTFMTFEAPYGEEFVFEESPVSPNIIDGKKSQSTARTWNAPKNTRYVYQLRETDEYFYMLNPQNDRVTTLKKIIVNNKLRSRIQRIEDRNGNSINYEYANNTTFLPSKISDGLGREISFNYTQIGNTEFLSSVKDSGDRVFSMTYGTSSGKNVITGLRDPENASTGFNYQSDEFISQVRNPLGNTPYSQTYTNNGVVSSQKNLFNNSTSLNVIQKSSSSTQTVTTNPDGTTRVFEHEKNARLVSKITDESGNAISYESDPNRELILAVVDRLGNRTTYTYHNETGKIKTIVNANGAKTEYGYLPQEQTFTNPSNNEQITFTFYNNSYLSIPDGYYEFQYDSKGNMISSRDIKGKTTTFTYNSKGQLLTTTNPLGETITNTYNTDGTLATTTDPETGTTTYSYDTLKRPVKITYPDGTSESYTYDSRDRVTSYTDANNNKYGFNYDLNGNLTSISTPTGKITSYEYDAMDRLSGITDRNGKKTTVSYDSRERISSVTTPDNIRTHYTYDPRGWVNSINKGGSATTVNYNAEGLPLDVNTFAGKNYKTEVDSLGFVTSVTDPLGNKTYFGWDQMGRLKDWTDPLHRSASFGWTAGKLTSVTLTQLGTATYTRNDLDLVTSINDLKGSTWLFEYTKLGKLSSMTDPLNNKWIYGFDKRGRVSNVTYPDAQSLAISYDGNGNILRQQYSNGPDIQNQYDTENRLVSSNNIQFSYDNEDRITDTTSLDTSFGATYDDAGKLTSVSYNNNQFTVTYTYNSTTGRLAGVTDSLTGTNLALNYNSDNQLVSISRPNNVTTTYTYDAAGRVTGIQHGAIANLSYTLDEAGQVTGVNYSAPVEPTVQAVTNTFTYDAASRITGSGWETDAQGRVTKTPACALFSWDGASRLIGIGGTTLAYNGLGDVLTSGSKTFFYNYAINFNPIVAEKSGVGFSRFYVWTPEGRLLYMIDATDGNKVYHYHFDNIGNTIALTDSAGVVKEAYAYSPYGKILGRKSTYSQPFTFVGEFGVRMEGATTDLYQMRARYYDATTGRFLSKEPIWPDLTQPKSINPYQYAFNSPINNIDITGLEAAFINDFWNAYSEWTRGNASLTIDPSLTLDQLIKLNESVDDEIKSVMNVRIEPEDDPSGFGDTIMKLSRAKHVILERVKALGGCIDTAPTGNTETIKKNVGNIHSINWQSTDNRGNQDGIGSRYFNIMNTN